MQLWCVTIYRDDSTSPVVYEHVKHVFWTAGNTVLVVAQFTGARVGADGDFDVGDGDHRYLQWPRERLAWFKVERMSAGPSAVE